MLEIIGCATSEEKSAESEQWALDLWDDVGKIEKKNILDGAYISLHYAEEPHSSTLGRYFGSHADKFSQRKRDMTPKTCLTSRCLDWVNIYRVRITTTPEGFIF